MQFWLLLMIALIPLAIAPGLLSAFDITPKIAILLVCDSALLLFCKQFVNGAESLRRSAIGRLYALILAAQLLTAAASTVGSSNPGLSLAGSSWRREGLIGEFAILIFALIATAWFVEDRTRIRPVLRTVAVTGIIESLYGIAQYFGWDPFLPSNAYLAGEGPFTIVRPPGTLGHADYLANWLVIVVFLALFMTKNEDDARWKNLTRVSVVLTSFAIVLSGTRSAMFGLIVGALVFLIIERPRLDRKTILVLAASIACLGVLYISPPGAKLRARVHWSLEDLRGGARLLLWRDSLHMAMERPLLGYGPETFTAQFPPFESVELAHAYPDFYHESPHNMFLDALASKGFPGALSLFALCVFAGWTARRNAALAGGIAAAIVCQQFLVLTIPASVYFYLLISIAVAEQIPATESRASRRIFLPIATVIAIGFFVFAVRLLLADRAMAVAEQRAAAGDVSAATESYRSVQRWAPPTGETDLNYSRAMTRVANTTHELQTSVAAAQQATDSAIRATTTAEDRQNAWYNLAIIDAARNDQAGVENALRRAIESAPNWFKPHWTLAQLLELTGRHQEARREAALALDLDGGHNPEVTFTSQKILNRP